MDKEKPSYWIDFTSGDNDVIINSEKITKLNQDFLSAAKRQDFLGYYHDLAKIKEKKLTNQLKLLLEKISPPTSLLESQFYDRRGNEISPAIKEDLARQIEINKDLKDISLKWGMIIKRSNLRAYPTAKEFYPQSDNKVQDLGQLTALSPGTPAIILLSSKNDNWYFVLTPFYAGWLKKEMVAPGEKQQVLKYHQQKDFLLVLESRIETEPSLADTSLSTYKFQMGDKIPLAPGGKAQPGCYSVKVPTLSKDEKLIFKETFLAKKNDVALDYLPYTGENIIKQAFKMLGERYGWGGLLNRRDCSRFIKDIFATLGLKLPRDAGKQEEIDVGESIPFSGGNKKRKDILKSLTPGDVLYMPGHVMLYLGERAGEYYVIHAGSGYRTIEGEKKDRPLYRVFVMKLSQKIKGKEKSYLQALSTAKKFY